MPFKDQAPRLNFLKDSAGSLSSASPSTAAYLMSVHNWIHLEEYKPLKQRQHETSCGACGYSREAKSTQTSVIKSKVKKSTPSVANGSTTDGATVYKCLRCRRRTITPSCRIPAHLNTAPKTTPKITPVANPQSPLPTPTALSEPAPGPTNPEIASKTAENASSKKRAKARKQGGLQALLASKQARANASPSLGLFDFLQ